MEFVMIFLLMWAWGWPESVGRWLADIRAGYDAAIRNSRET